MGKIKVTTCDIEGLYVIEPTVFKDERGYFMETYNQNDFKEAGLNMTFVQDNQSMSVKGVLMRLSLLISVLISIIQAMRAVCYGAILRSVLTGRSNQVWS